MLTVASVYSNSDFLSNIYYIVFFVVGSLRLRNSIRMRGKGYRGVWCGLDRDELECSNVRNGESSFAVSPNIYISIYVLLLVHEEIYRNAERPQRMRRMVYVCLAGYRCYVTAAAAAWVLSVWCAHSRDLQLMKLGCSRVACQINMSPTLFVPGYPYFPYVDGVRRCHCFLSRLDSCSFRLFAPARPVVTVVVIAHPCSLPLPHAFLLLLLLLLPAQTSALLPSSSSTAVLWFMYFTLFILTSVCIFSFVRHPSKTLSRTSNLTCDEKLLLT